MQKNGKRFSAWIRIDGKKQYLGWIHLRRLPERTIMLPSNLPSKQDVQQGIPDTSWNYLATKMMVKVLRDTGFRQYG